MTKNMKRLLAMMMAMVMVFTMIPAEVFAQDLKESNDDAEWGAEEAQYDGPVAEMFVDPTNYEGTFIGTYNTLQEAFTEAKKQPRFVFVRLLKDVTISTEHTLDQDINLSTNGHNLVIEESGSITGNTGISYPVIDVMNYSSNGGSITNKGVVNAEIDGYADDVSISIEGGSVENIMLFEGTLDVSGGTINWIQSWGTAEISGGTITSFGPENGESTITGGTIGSINVMNNDGSPTVDIKGDVTVTDELLLEYFGGDDKCGIETVTISGSPKIYRVGFNIQKFGEEEDDGTGNWGSITISGGYFGNNPKEILDGRDAVQTAHIDIDIPELEAYTSQTDWAVDHTVYGYRIVDANPSADYVVKVDYRYMNGENPDPIYETVKYESIEAALKATETADYKDKCAGFQQYTHPVMTLLKNVTIDKVINFNLNADRNMGQIVVEMNGHNLEITDDGGLTGTGELMIEGTKKGKFISSGTLGLSDGEDGNIFINSGCDFTVTGGTVTSRIQITTGDVNISGGEFTGELDLVNSNADKGLKATISGSAKMKNIRYQVNKYISSISLNLLGGYYAQSPESFKTFDTGHSIKDQTDYVNYDATKLEQYASQTDWEADPTTYTYRIRRDASAGSYSKAPAGVTGLVESGSAQELITGGTAVGGTIKYALGTDATTAPESGWSTSVPSATAAGTYYVWYRLDPDADHTGIAAACITVSITKSSTDDPTTDDPTTDDPTTDDPTTDDPTTDDPTTDDPTTDDPTIVDPTTDDPTTDDPTTEDPTKDDPTKDDPTKDDPTKDDPTKEDPTKDEPTKDDPTKEDPIKEDPTKDDTTNENPTNDDTDNNVEKPDPTSPLYSINVVEGASAKDSAGKEVRTAREKEQITISWTVKADYDFVKWDVTGATPRDQVSANTVFTMPAQDVTVSYEEKLKVSDQVLEELPSSVEADKEVKIKSIKFSAKKLTLEKNEKKEFKADAVAAGADLPKVYYVTDNKDIVAVDRDGNFYATGIGETTVTAYCGNKKAKVNITVVCHTKNISIIDDSKEESTTIEMNAGETEFLTVSFEPYDSTDSRAVKWTSDNKKVAVKNGIITAKEVKEAVSAKVTATVKYTNPKTGKTADLSKTVTVNVKPVEVLKASSADKSHTLKIGKKSLKLDTADAEKATAEITVNIKAKGEASAVKILSVESTNNRIVSVDNVSAVTADGKKGSATVKLQSQAAGTAYIIVKTSGAEGSENIQRCKVTVTSAAKGIVVKSGTLKVNDKTMTLRKGSSGTIEVTLDPEYSTDLGKLKISGSKGVTVKNGVIHAKKITDAATITVKCGKLKETISVTVTK